MHSMISRAARSTSTSSLIAQPSSFHMVLQVFLLLALDVIAGQSASFQTNSIEGWTTLVSERLLAEDKAATERALELLRAQLKEVVRVAPPPAVAKLREVTLWFSPEDPGVKPAAEYHPARRWLREDGRDEDLPRGIEFTNVRTFEAESRRMPNFTLHELAHAYHHRTLSGGFDNAEIKAAYNRAKASGSYDEVERSFGDGRPNTRGRAYADR